MGCQYNVYGFLVNSKMPCIWSPAWDWRTGLSILNPPQVLWFRHHIHQCSAGKTLPQHQSITTTAIITKRMKCRQFWRSPLPKTNSQKITAYTGCLQKGLYSFGNSYEMTPKRYRDRFCVVLKGNTSSVDSQSPLVRNRFTTSDSKRKPSTR